MAQSETRGRLMAVRRLGRTHQSYWDKRLKKRSYVAGGKTITIPSWQVRIAHLGRREWFNLETSNKGDAAVKAKEIFVSLVAHGWENTLAKFKPGMVIAKGDMTVDEFSDFFRQAVDRVEDPPSKPTLERYITSLAFICQRVGVAHISALTPERVKQFRGEYLADARREKRQDKSAKVSCNAMMRNAAAVFSEKMLAQYHVMGLQVSNPFVGQKVLGVKLKPYSALRPEMLDAIWRDSVKLRDGDPEALDPVKVHWKKGEKRYRWKVPPDFQKPHLEEYALLLLELGLGLRRNEADKAQKDWLFTDADGRHFIKVQETPYFRPKNKESRSIPVELTLYTAIKAVMDGHVSPFIVPGRLPKHHDRKDAPKSLVYRLDRHHRALATWLRRHGIDDDKPCHRLRKEFGSYVATAFGLFHAQRFLGHSSPTVTEAFYAALTNIPELENVKGRIPQPKKGTP